MEDLSHIFGGMYSDPISALIPTAQAAGNQSHDSNALTAPGGEPASDLRGTESDVIVHDAPVVDAEDYTRSPVEIGPGGGKVNADSNDDRPSLFTVPGGDVWKSSRETGNPVPDITPRSMLRRGEWNIL